MLLNGALNGAAITKISQLRLPGIKRRLPCMLGPFGYQSAGNR